MEKTQSALEFVRTVDAGLDDVSYAFFTAQGWRDWMCDSVRFQAIIDVTPTVPELLDRLERSKAETLALLSRAEKLKARKGVLWGLGQGMLSYPDQHERSHMEQIEIALKAAKEA